MAGTGASAAALALALTGTSAAHAATGGTSPSQPAPTSAATIQHPITGAQFMARLGDKTVETVSPGGKPVQSTRTDSGVRPSIVGGSNADISQFPYLVQLALDLGPANDGSGDDLFLTCAGTLIAPTQVLTAGHCVHGQNWANNPNGVVWAGSTENILDVPENQIPDGEGAEVVHQWVDPNWSMTADGAALNDVAVLTLAAPIGTATLPLATPSQTSLYTAGNTATIAGWGVTDPQDTDPQPATTLQTASIPVAANSSCESVYGSTDYLPSEMVCAGNGSGTPTTCQGDSGGPLIVSGTLVGVVSYGPDGCDVSGTYAVFAKASAYFGPLMDWAESFSGFDGTETDNGTTYLINNGIGDLMGQTSAGEVYEYGSTGSGGLASRIDYLGGTKGAWLGQEDLEQSGLVGVLIRDTSGNLYYVGWDKTGQLINGTGSEQIGWGWNIYNSIIPMGNVAGASAPDLVARDSSGELWLYLGYGNTKFATRVKIGAGWNAYNLIVGDGDFNGDGYADLIARDTSGRLWYYQGTGNWRAPFKPRVQIGYDYQIYSHMAVINNFMGNGLAALVGADSSGNLYVYKSTGSSTSPLSSRVKIGYDYQIYSRLF
jgi:hypothetical protein